MVPKSCLCVFLFARRLVNKSAVTLRNKFISQKAFLAEDQARQKECLSVPVMAEFAALFCTARKAEQYDASAVESLSVQWKGSPVQWNPASVQWKASPVQWKDQLRAVESWSSQHYNNIFTPGSGIMLFCDSLLRVQPIFGGLAEPLRGGTSLPRRC